MVSGRKGYIQFYCFVIGIIKLDLFVFFVDLLLFFLIFVTFCFLNDIKVKFNLYNLIFHIFHSESL